MIERIVSMESSRVSGAASGLAERFGLIHDIRGRGGANSDTTGTQTNVLVEDSDGSLYFALSQQSTSRYETVKRSTLRLNRPLIVLNLAREGGFFASRRISSWITENQIKILHLDGDDHLESETLSAVVDILESTLLLIIAGTGTTSPKTLMERVDLPALTDAPPATITEALDHLESALPLKQRALIANMSIDTIPSMNATLGEYINTHFNLYTDNTDLLKDCRQRSGQPDLAPKHAAAMIIRALWEHLRATCRIRVVK
jgi:hypothetical protein